MPSVNVCVVCSIVHWFKPLFAHSANIIFIDLFAVTRSYPVRSSSPQRSKASSINSVTSGSKFVLFDVGANWGTDSLERTQIDENIITWAFEPVPELIANLTTKSAEYSYRYHVVPSAVSDFDGTAQFNVAVGISI